MSTPTPVTSLDPALRARCAAIRLLVLDVDGVLTDGRLYYTAEGETMKAFHVHDGYGLRMLRESGVRIAVISGRSARATERRLRELGIEEIHLGCDDKGALLDRLLEKFRCGADALAVVGDDAPDLPMLRRAGVAVAVADAQPPVLAVADLVTQRPGGRGAVREFCDLLLEARAADA